MGLLGMAPSYDHPMPSVEAMMVSPSFVRVAMRLATGHPVLPPQPVLNPSETKPAGHGDPAPGHPLTHLAWHERRRCMERRGSQTGHPGSL